MNTEKLKELLAAATPGPWEAVVEPEEVCTDWCVKSGDAYIASVHPISFIGEPDFGSRKNAELIAAMHKYLPSLLAELEQARKDAGRLDYIERKFSGMTNRERYLTVQMIWGKGCNGRTLREACDKYMARDFAPEAQP